MIILIYQVVKIVRHNLKILTCFVQKKFTVYSVHGLSSVSQEWCVYKPPHCHGSEGSTVQLFQLDMGNGWDMQRLQEHLTTGKKYIFLPEDMIKSILQVI